MTATGWLVLLLTTATPAQPGPTQRATETRRAPPRAPQLSPDVLYEKRARTVVRVENGGRTGSGVILRLVGPKGRNALVVTNLHVVGADQTVATVRQGERSWFASLVGRSQTLDLALLNLYNLRDDELETAPLAPQAALPPRPGQRCFAIGTPQGLEGSLSEGLISAVRTDGPVTWLQTTAPISPGSSGGALFDASGNLIGITTALAVNGENLGFAVSASHVWELLRAYEAVVVNDTPGWGDLAELRRRLLEAELLHEALKQQIWQTEARQAFEKKYEARESP